MVQQLTIDDSSRAPMIRTSGAAESFANGRSWAVVGSPELAADLQRIPTALINAYSIDWPVIFPSEMIMNARRRANDSDSLGLASHAYAGFDLAQPCSSKA